MFLAALLTIFLVKLQRQQGLASRVASATATPMVPTPIQTPAQSTRSLAPGSTGMRKLSLSSGSPPLKKKSIDGSEPVVTVPTEPVLPLSTRIGNALKTVWGLIKKYSIKGFKKFVDWLDEEGSQQGKENDELIDMGSSSGEDDAGSSKDMKKSLERKETEKKFKSSSHDDLAQPTSGIACSLSYP